MDEENGVLFRDHWLNETFVTAIRGQVYKLNSFGLRFNRCDGQIHSSETSRDLRRCGPNKVCFRANVGMKSLR
jgi:hypothetical protein